MGYYPTPLGEVDRIRTFLRFPPENVNVLDPCCGEGAALSRLVEGTKARTYGIELDRHRAEQDRAVLDNVLPCGYEDARVSKSAFSCLFLNPPYDWVSGREPEREASERKEKSFLRGTLRYLRPDGVLVHIVPQKRVTPGVARLLSSRFADFNTYRFLDDDYEQFRQIALFGRRKKQGRLDTDALDMLRYLPRRDLGEIPCLENPTGTSGFLLPAWVFCPDSSRVPPVPHASAIP